MSSSPFSNSVAVLGKSVTIRGQIHSQEDLTIDGIVEGSIEVGQHRLTVGQNGDVRADVKAHEFVILGTVHGNAEATGKVDIRSKARFIGDIKSPRIGIEDGAYFKGAVDITRPNQAGPAKP